MKRTPRSSDTAARVLAAYAAMGAMTVGQCARALGIHSERIRPTVKRPQYQCIGYDGKARIWALAEGDHGKQATSTKKSV